jgi:hypothetical protein
MIVRQVQMQVVVTMVVVVVTRVKTMIMKIFGILEPSTIFICR